MVINSTELTKKRLDKGFVYIRLKANEFIIVKSQFLRFVYCE